MHANSGPTIESYIKLTYNDCVYFNEHLKLFKVEPVSTFKTDVFTISLALTKKMQNATAGSSVMISAASTKIQKSLMISSGNTSGYIKKNMVRRPAILSGITFSKSFQ